MNSALNNDVFNKDALTKTVKKLINEQTLLTLFQQLKEALEQQRRALAERNVQKVASLTKECGGLCHCLQENAHVLLQYLSDHNSQSREALIELGRACKLLQKKNFRDLERLSLGVEALTMSAGLEDDAVYCPDIANRRVYRSRSLIKV